MNPFLRIILSCGVGGCVTLHAAGSGVRSAPAPDRSAEVRLDAPALADTFAPDVYPSSADAARQLGKRWGRAAGSATVEIECPSPSVALAFSEGMTLANPALRVAAAGAADLRVFLAVNKGELESDADASDDDHQARGGTITLKTAEVSAARSEVATMPMSERFVEKPWLADFAGFIASHPDGRWIIGKSDPRHPALTSAEAARAARRAAADEVARVVRSKLRGGARLEDWRVRDAVIAHLVDGNDLVADRFPQAFDRGYGTIYREAVLVNASDEAIQPIVDEVLAVQHHDRNHRARTFAGGLAVMLVTLGLYRLANFITRGYFTWKLRTVAAIAVVGALVVLAHLP